ncbi:hypothetical protein [Bacillus sp. S/N-304-OC-R1]|uniref:hypothetical protein n=1 Tax=Bacillus sp. S/N-304-OC-R1 TaxID=2758034 RepID=UPI001C8DD8DD|nr:hypothetical protein [Bacillus sp. S/N-304-OC-R1]MBY0123193.1 hypothetical protein [Bacillus sp. S/N-304-OC-R1]
MKKVKQQLLRAKNIPELIIVNKPLDKEIIKIKEFSELALKPYIKTGARLTENIVELPVWDDMDQFNDLIPPWGFHKFCNYQVSEFGLGMVHIIFNVGKKIRKNNDFRFRDEIKTDTNNYYFLFDFQKRHYIEVNPETNQDWITRIEQMENLEKDSFGFIQNYLTNIRPEFNTKITTFINKNRKTYIEIKKYFEAVDTFLNDTWLYLDLLLIIYGDISSEEHCYLEQSIRNLKRLMSEANSYIEVFNENYQYDPTADYLNRTDKSSGFGIVTETFYALESNFSGRKEKIEDGEWFVYNPSRGYLSAKNNKLFPNIAEVERRRSLYEKGANSESESNLTNEILRRLKKC